MHLIVCVDDRYGMLFHNRRLSSDKLLTQRLLELCRDSVLWVDSYSEKLFRDIPGTVTVTDDPLSAAEIGQWCFVEKGDILLGKDRIESVLLCRWNRKYPADTYFPTQILGGRQPVAVEEFQGNSHDKITLERYQL